MSSMTGYGGVKLQLRSMNYEGLSEDVENASRAGGGYDTLFVSVCDESGLVLSSVNGITTAILHHSVWKVFMKEAIVCR